MIIGSRSILSYKTKTFIFGKHKGAKLSDLVRDEPFYINWCLEQKLLTDEDFTEKQFQFFLKQHAKHKQIAYSTRKQEKEDSDFSGPLFSKNSSWKKRESTLLWEDDPATKGRPRGGRYYENDDPDEN